MRRKINWDWESQLTVNERNDMAILSSRSDELMQEIENIDQRIYAIKTGAIARAKAAGVKVPTFTL